MKIKRKSKIFGVILIMNRSTKMIGGFNKFNNGINFNASILDKVEESKEP